MSTGGGDSKKRLFARPTALLVDAVPSRITMPVPPPITMRLPEPETPVPFEEEPLAGPARLFIGAPRAVPPLSVRAGLDRRPAPVESDVDDPSAGPAVPFPLKRTPFDSEPPPLPNRWGGSVAKADPRSAEIARAEREKAERDWSDAQAKADVERNRLRAEQAWADERAQTERDLSAQASAEQIRSERQWSEQANAERAREEQAKAERANAERAREEQAKAERAREEQAKAERANAERAREEQAKAERAREEQAKAERAREAQAKSARAVEVPATPRVDRPLQPMVVGPAKPGQHPYVPTKPSAAKKKGIHPGTWASLGVLFLSVGILGTWWEIRDSVVRENRPEAAVREPVVVVQTPAETPPEPPPETPPEAAVPEVVPEPVVVEPVVVQRPPAVPPEAVVVPKPPPKSEKPPSNPMEKAPLVERPIVVAERPTKTETTSKAEAPPQIRPGVLRVTSTTPAKVYVDGKIFGQVEKDVMIELAPGVHDVKLVAKKGGRSQTQRVRVDSGGAIMLNYEFK